jgi:hypothetical protein
MNKINWNWKRSRAGATSQILGVRVRITLTESAQNHNITLSEDFYSALGSPNSVCFGVSKDGVFVTSQRVGTPFNVTKKGSNKPVFIFSKYLSEAIFDHFGIDTKQSGFIDLDYAEVDNGVFQLKHKTATRFNFL